jgi:hypothetical protein
MLSRRACLVGLSVVPFATAAQAHHGFTGRYDTNAPLWLEGTVQSAAFAPPHPVIRLLIDPGVTTAPTGLTIEGLTGPLRVRPDDAGRTIEIELPPVSTFFDLSSAVTPNIRLALVALRNCTPPHQVRSQWLRFPDGRIVQREQRMSYMVAGCPT